jgi:hypothetical protein
MAVLDALPGVEVSVSASGKELTEYEERKEEDEPLAVKTVLRYIESISGSEFMINLKISPPFRFDYPQIGFRVFVDGKYIAGKGCSSHRLVAGHWNSSVLGIDTLLPDGSTGIRKFIFNSIKTSNVYSIHLGHHRR